MQLDLASIIAQATALTQQQTSQASEVASLYGQASQEAGTQAENLIRAGTLASEAELTKLQGELATQQAGRKAAQAFGTDVNAQGEVVTQLGELQRNLALELIQQQARVGKIEKNSNLLSNPVGWLTDLMYGDDARGDRDATAQQFETVSNVSSKLHLGTQTAVATQEAISETLTATSIKQLADVQLLNAQNKAAEARISAAQYGIGGIQALQEVGARNFMTAMNVYNAVESDMRWREARKDMLEARNSKKALDTDIEEFTQRVNTFRKAAGQVEYTPAQVKRHWEASQEARQLLMDQEARGMRILDNGGSVEGAFGPTPADAMETVKGYEIMTPNSWAPSMGILENANAVLQEKLSVVDPKTGKPLSANVKDPSQLKQMYNETVREEALGLQKAVVHGSSNAFEIPPIPSVLSSPSAGELKQSKFGQTVLANLQASGHTSPAPELVIASGLAELEKGNLSMNDLRDGIAEYYTQGKALLAATGGFATLNVPVTPDYRVPAASLLPNPNNARVASKSAFGMAWQTLGSFSPTQVINPTQRIPQSSFDLTDPTDVTTAVIMIRSKKLADDILKNTRGNNE